MATSARLSNFAILASRIESLGGKARGMRLAADDWNRLVGSLVEALVTIGRSQDEARAYLDRAYAPIDHEHPGEVTTLWLEPGLRDQVATGGEALPTRQALAAMQQSIAQLRAENARLTARLEALEGWRNPGIFTPTNEEFDRRLQIVEEHSITMDSIIKTQNGFKKDVKNLVELRSHLTDEAGAPIDISALSRRITDLDALRDRLEGVDGKPLSLKELQLQVLELADRPVGGGRASAEMGFATFRADLLQVAQESETRFEQLREELTTANHEALGQFTIRLNQVESDNRDGIAATHDLVRSAETRLAAGFTNEIGATRTTLMATLRQQAGEAVDERLSGVDARIEGLIATRATELRTRLIDEIGKPLNTRLTQSLAEATGRLDTKFAGIEARVRAATDSIPQELTKGLASVETNLQTRVDSRFTAKATELSQSLAGQVEQKVTAGINAGLIEVRAAASQTVTDRLANLDTRIAASVTNATRDLPDRIAATVDTRLQQVNIPGQIAAANRQLDTELRREIATTAANVQSINSTALNSAMTNLRADFTTRPAPDFRVQPDLRGRPGPSG